MRTAFSRLLCIVLLFWAPAAFAQEEDEGGGEEPAAAAEPEPEPEPEPQPEPEPAAEPEPEAAEPEPEPAAEPEAAEPEGADDTDPDPAADSDPAPDADADADAAGDSDVESFDDSAGDAFGDEPPINSDEYLEEWGEPYIEYDTDGDGEVSAAEAAFEKEYEAAFADIPDEITDEALDARPEDAELLPSITVEHFRMLVRLAKTKVLERLKAKIEQKAQKRMAKVSLIIAGFSLLGLLLLAMPLALKKKYPGQGSLLFKYSALAAATFVLTVNLFGAVMMLMRGTQAALAEQTNPQLAIAGGFFDTLDENAPRFVPVGKELFAPTLEQLQGATDEQPAVALLANGQKLMKDAKVFLRVAKVFERVDFLLGYLPMILLGVTLVLFIIAIKPTLIEIVKLPAQVAASGTGGGDTFRNAIRKVLAEGKATLCTIGVLIVLSLLAGTILGQVVQPALEKLLGYFVVGVMYLQFVEGASSGMVFLMLFSVILFLVLELAVVILSMSFFLGKSQKIFQQRFSQGVTLQAHARFWQWGSASVIWAQLYPLLYMVIAGWGLEKINARVLAGATDAESVNWSALMLAGPLFLVFGFLVLLWGSQSLRSLMFLVKYKPKDVVGPR